MKLDEYFNRNGSYERFIKIRSHKTLDLNIETKSEDFMLKINER